MASCKVFLVVIYLISPIGWLVIAPGGVNSLVIAPGGVNSLWWLPIYSHWSVLIVVGGSFMYMSKAAVKITILKMYKVTVNWHFDDGVLLQFLLNII